MKDFTELYFPVRRRFLSIMGWLFMALGILALASILIGSEYHSLWEILGAVSCIPIGMLMVRAVRNVREIQLEEHRLVFKPVGTELPLSDIRSISFPNRAGRHDDWPRGSGILTVKTFSNTIRLVPGAVIQGPRTCVIYVHGSDSVGLIRALQERIPNRPTGEIDPSAE